MSSRQGIVCIRCGKELGVAVMKWDEVFPAEVYCFSCNERVEKLLAEIRNPKNNAGNLFNDLVSGADKFLKK